MIFDLTFPKTRRLVLKRLSFSAMFCTYFNLKLVSFILYKFLFFIYRFEKGKVRSLYFNLESLWNFVLFKYVIKIVLGVYLKHYLMNSKF
jgi:hypothetical protein